MKLTKKEFELLVNAVKMHPSSVGLGGVFMRALLSKGNPDDEKAKEVQEALKKEGELLEKDVAIIIGKLYQLESEIVEQ